MLLLQVVLASSLLASTALVAGLPHPHPSRTSMAPHTALSRRAPKAADSELEAEPTITKAATWGLPDMRKYKEAEAVVFPNIGKMDTVNLYPVGVSAEYIKGRDEYESKGTTYTVKLKLHNAEDAFHEEATLLSPDKEKLQVDILDCVIDEETSKANCTLTQSLSDQDEKEYTAAPDQKMKWAASKFPATVLATMPPEAQKMVDGWANSASDKMASWEKEYSSAFPEESS